MDPLPASSLLAAALGVILKKKKMLVKETSQGFLELPGYNIAKPEEAIRRIQELTVTLNLSDLPQQTLYLTKISIADSKTKKTPAIVRIIHVSPATNLNYPNAWFESLTKLQTDDRASTLTKAVAQRLTNK